MEKIMLFQVPEPEASKIRRLAAGKRIRVISVERTDWGFLLGNLAAGNAGAKPPQSPSPDFLPEESLMVFCQVSQKHFDKLLFEMRDKKIPVDFKAVLTETNRHWTVSKLYEELARERQQTLHFDEKGVQ